MDQPKSADPIRPDVRAHIASKLAAVATEHNVRILYAAESGSRAWGFASPDSDYDVRFIYAHTVDWYLRLADGRDVIEKGIDERLIDLNGWDVRKALRLLLKSNPVLYEWLVSPINYADDGTFRPAVTMLFERHASPSALARHYWSIARTQWRSEIDGREQVKLKKYFYLIRPLLSLVHVAHVGKPPPMQLGELLASAANAPGGESLASGLGADIAHLLELKRTLPELGLGERIPALVAWAVDTLQRLHPDNLSLMSIYPADSQSAAEKLFRQSIG